MHAIAGASIVLSEPVYVQPAVSMQLRKAAIGQHTSKVVCSAAAGVVKGRDANATKGSIEAVKGSPCGSHDRHCLESAKGSMLQM